MYTSYMCGIVMRSTWCGNPLTLSVDLGCSSNLRIKPSKSAFQASRCWRICLFRTWKIPSSWFMVDAVDGNQKSGKLTSWGNGSLSTIIYRVFTHPRWLFGISSINSISKKWMNFGAPLLIWGGVCQVIGAIQRRQQKLFPTMNHCEIGTTYSFCDTPRSKKIQSLLKLSKKNSYSTLHYTACLIGILRIRLMEETLHQLIW